MLALKSIVFSATLGCISVSSSAQQQVGRNIDDHLLIKSANTNLHSQDDAEVIGSPYLNELFVPGTVYTFDTKFADLPMRYNIYHDYIEFQQNKQTFILDPEVRIKKVTLDDKTFVVVKFDFKGKNQAGFLQQLDTGSATLFAKKIVQYRESQPPKALESSATPAKYTNAQSIYFLQVGKGEAIKIESLKQMIDALPGHKEEVEAFTKQEKISIKKEVDLIKLVRHYNAL